MKKRFSSTSSFLIFCSIILFNIICTKNIVLAEINVKHLPISKLAQIQDYSFKNLLDLESEKFKEIDSNFLWKNFVPSYLDEFFKKENNLKKYLSDNETPCTSSINEWIREIKKLLLINNEEQPANWALQMIDSFGKIPAGIMHGNLFSLGDFVECVSTRGSIEKSNTKFQGQYCTTYILPKFLDGNNNKSKNSSETDSKKGKFFFQQFQNDNKNMSNKGAFKGVVGYNEVFNYIMYPPTIGTCFPSTCSHEEIIVLMHLALDFNITLGEDGKYINIGEQASAFPVACYTDDYNLSDGDITIIVILGLIFSLCIIGTIADYFYMGKKNKKGEIEDSKKEIGVGLKLILSWSLYTNVKKLFNTQENGDSLGCIHGIRFLSLCWVILAHTWTSLMFEYKINMVDILRLPENNWSILAIINGTVSVDTFFTLSGLLVSYNLLKALDKFNGKLNVPLIYLHRYLRLTPMYAILIGILATIFNYFANVGPWGFMAPAMANGCKDYWWRNLLYIQNLFSYNSDKGEEMCFGSAWYLAIDMQFFIFTPLIIFPIWYKEKLGLFLLTFYTIGLGVLSPAIVTYVKDLPPTNLIFSMSEGDYMNDFYTKPYCRFGPYAIGIWTGWILHKLKSRKIKLTKSVAIAGWLISTATALAIIFGMENYFKIGASWTKATAIIYGGVHRLAWGMVISWVIFACVKGYGWWINEFLSWKAFIPLARLSYATYLVSFYLQIIMVIYIGRNSTYYDVFLTVNLFFSHLLLSLLVAIICTLTMEAPFMQIEKIIFKK